MSSVDDRERERGKELSLYINCTLKKVSLTSFFYKYSRPLVSVATLQSGAAALLRLLSEVPFDRKRKWIMEVEEEEEEEEG